MDRTHDEFATLLSDLLSRGTNLDLAALETLKSHLVSHFRDEDEWMVETDFPPRACHMDEHAAVLRSAEDVLSMSRMGNFDAAPAFVAELARWFPGHLDFLDSALAAWMCKRAYGGKPVVFHRSRIRSVE
ncbi:bacteriohemerythrin [Ramlibacter albus]|uniref:Hemerythrin n=1 Tax=Ramlibacter albus TaxID=2079448 RepID=A0A923M5I2_9BURK|nr:hemerythrin domain-containing protein [Ramlibacter albus]MBC5763049.1 hemerythrin [Ramlibacter albus]